MRGRKKEEGGG